MKKNVSMDVVMVWLRIPNPRGVRRVCSLVTWYSGSPLVMHLNDLIIFSWSVEMMITSPVYSHGCVLNHLIFGCINNVMNLLERMVSVTHLTGSNGSCNVADHLYKTRSIYICQSVLSLPSLSLSLLSFSSNILFSIALPFSSQSTFASCMNQE